MSTSLQLFHLRDTESHLSGHWNVLACDVDIDQTLYKIYTKIYAKFIQNFPKQTLTQFDNGKHPNNDLMLVLYDLIIFLKLIGTYISKVGVYWTDKYTGVYLFHCSNFDL